VGLGGSSAQACVFKSELPKSVEERISHSVDTALKEANFGAYFEHVATICERGLACV
jgi:hypothetical protein